MRSLPEITTADIVARHDLPDDAYYRWLFTEYGVTDISAYSSDAVREALQFALDDRDDAAALSREARALLEELGAFAEATV